MLHRPSSEYGISMNGHELLAHTLKTLGVTHVYGLSGVPIQNTLPACSQLGIRPIGVRHQQAAVLMAAAHNYRSGRLAAVAIVSAGPAVTNTATGILVAKDNCWPVMVLAGTKTNRPGQFQVLEGVQVFQSMTKWSAEIPAPSKIGECLAHGYRVALSEQPGPVYLEIPEAVLVGTAAFNLSPFPQSELPVNNASAQIAHASKILVEAQRPALIMERVYAGPNPTMNFAR